MDEVTLSAPTIVWEVRDGEVKRYLFDPRSAGSNTPPPGYQGRGSPRRTRGFSRMFFPAFPVPPGTRSSSMPHSPSSRAGRRKTCGKGWRWPNGRSTRGRRWTGSGRFSTILGTGEAVDAAHHLRRSSPRPGRAYGEEEGRPFRRSPDRRGPIRAAGRSGGFWETGRASSRRSRGHPRPGDGSGRTSTPPKPPGPTRRAGRARCRC